MATHDILQLIQKLKRRIEKDDHVLADVLRTEQQFVQLSETQPLDIYMVQSLVHTLGNIQLFMCMYFDEVSLEVVHFFVNRDVLLDDLIRQNWKWNSTDWCAPTSRPIGTTISK